MRANLSLWVYSYCPFYITSSQTAMTIGDNMMNAFDKDYAIN
jgi:hypothetical protein